MSLQTIPQDMPRSPFANNASTARVFAKQARREAFEQLSQALKSFDLPSACLAYARLRERAPAAASWPPDSTFAQVGAALTAADLSAAQDAFDRMVS